MLNNPYTANMLHHHTGQADLQHQMMAASGGFDLAAASGYNPQLVVF